MTIRVALQHRTRYTFDRPTALGPHEMRLRPAPHCRTPIVSYSLKVTPRQHLVHWQQDAYGNHVARFVFPEKTRELVVNVDLVADLTVINPFDFLVEPGAAHYPFRYTDAQAAELVAYLSAAPAGARLAKWLADFHAGGYAAGETTTGFLVALNQRLSREIEYLVRMEPGVQDAEETLAHGSGSCRDSGWLLVQILRHLGIAARFVSGYLVQLAGEADPSGDASGPERDSVDLHAWAEAYLPGAGWIGLDPTSGLLAGECHIPLACAAAAASAAPIIGSVGECESQLAYEASVARVNEDPPVTRSYDDAQWAEIDALGLAVDRDLEAHDVRLMHGGEPTFVSIDDMEGAAWNHAALSPEKWELAQRLAWRLHHRFAQGGLFTHGQGKWYPGESTPRWALGIYWRLDGTPIWRDIRLIARDRPPVAATLDDARQFAADLADRLGFDPVRVLAAYEDPLPALQQEGALPVNVDLATAPMGNAEERARLARTLAHGLDRAVGYVLPVRARKRSGNPDARGGWVSSPWPLRREKLYLFSGDAPMGARLPLASLPEPGPGEFEPDFERDPFDARDALHDAHLAAEKHRHAGADAGPTVRTALCFQVREDCLHVFMPPLTRLEDYLDLVAAIELTAAARSLPVRVDGYGPPIDPRIRGLQVTPDPGVIEVNTQPAGSWRELAEITTAIYDEARGVRLGTDKFLHDGRHVGTGGGSHITLGGPTAVDSPFLRRPDLLASLLTYWQNHPSLSYLFSGRFVGATSQAPRVDEAREDNLYELEIALQQLARECPPGTESAKPWLVDRLLRNFLVDLTGNAHRTEFCIDKLYSPHGPSGRLGVVEMRACEMPPHAHMSLVRALLIRALVARFWKTPYPGRLMRWGTQLHDRWVLPFFIEQDIRDVTRDVRQSGYAFRDDWLAPFLEFRFPRLGAVSYEGIRVELRQAIEPWNVLGDEMDATGTARAVDSSVDRLQITVQGMTGDRHLIACNGRPLPLHPTGVQAEFVAGVRFKAFNPSSARHPTIGVQAPLVFDLVDTWSGRSLGGCTYHVTDPGAQHYERLPVNSHEAEARRAARFWSHGHTPGAMAVRPEPPNRDFPYTLDLRRQPG
ncbi:MAG: transglutaminase family protein [Betaproteobacteria bacterium]|nr:transglutaminase family protein [Betaproteobacteria bacterium]